jgi:leucyl aminopeptidase
VGPPVIEAGPRAARAGEVDASAIGMWADRTMPRVAVPGALSTAAAAAVESAAARLRFSARPRETARIPAPDGVPGDLAVLVGLGPATTDDSGAAAGSPDARRSPAAALLRRAAAAATRSVTGLQGVERLSVVLPAADAESLRAVAEGALLGGYAFTWYRTAPAAGSANGTGADGSHGPDAAADPADHTLSTVVVDTGAARVAGLKRKDLETAIALGGRTAEAVWLARDLVNLSPVDLPPAAMADVARTVGEATGLGVTVLDEAALRDEGYGGLLAVGGGSTRPPRLVVVEHRPRRPRARVALVGKGITFDSGGLSLKPAAAMTGMKSDMAGAAAVLAAVVAAARADLPVHVTGYLAMAENMPSGAAQRPSDVIRILGGRTVEVLNTDAEGRLVLADAIVAASRREPDAIIDVATLTGAALVALGPRTSGFFANDDLLAQRLAAAADAADEPTWRMPLAEELRPGLDSAVADIANITPKRDGGMIVGALFVREFVGTRGDGRPIPWAHLDVAGPAFSDAKAEDLTPKGGTGVPTRTLVRLLESFAGDRHA